MAPIPPNGPGRILVLGMEAATVPHCRAGVGEGGRVTDTGCAHHPITHLTMLRATERDDGTWSDLSFISLLGGRDHEPGLLRRVDAELRALQRDGGTLVTCNGAQDTTALNRRCARHLMFDMAGIASAHGDGKLVALFMRDAQNGKGGTELEEAAAELGIPAAQQLAGKASKARSVAAARSQTKVATAFIVMLYELATLRRDAGPVIHGWRALGDHILGMSPQGGHLAHFRHHPLGRATGGGRKAVPETGGAGG